MAAPHEEEKIDVNDKAPIQVVSDSETPEYDEYISLDQIYQGKDLKVLTRKIDYHVIPILIFIYMLSYIDRSNVGNARLFGAQTDLGLSGPEWNVGLALIFVSQGFGGIPFNAILKIIGPRWALSATFLGVSVVVIASGCSSNIGAWYSLRLLLGLFEAGIFVGAAFVLSTWYTPSQLQLRLSVFYVGATSSGAVSGLLAYGLGQLDGTWGYRGWRWLYVVEGLISFVVAIGGFFLIQDSPAKRNRWLTEQETRFVVLRNRYAYGKDKSGSRDDFTWKEFGSAAKSYHVWVLAFGYFTFCTAIYGFSLTLPTIINNMGFSAADAQALSVPPYAFATICVLICGWYADKYKRRMLTCVLASTMGFIGLIICLTTAVYPRLVAVTYIGVCLTAGGLYCLSPALAAWIGLNTAGQSKRAAGMALGVFCSQLGGVLGSNIYIAAEKPRYPVGFGLSLALLFVGNILVPIIYWWYIGRENARRDAMSEETIAQMYTPEELTSLGDLSPYYRYER